MNTTLFRGISALYGTKGLERLINSHVLILGLGGVGSWIAEALARSGVGQLTLVDMDEICVSNINRQLHALHSTVGLSKVEVLKKRIHDINPDCKVNAIVDFFTIETKDQILNFPYSFVIDAIDSLNNKCLAIKECDDRGLKIITLGGAGGLTDPTQIRISDLGKSFNDPLLQRVRKKLRQSYGYEKGKKAKFRLPCVFSPEESVNPEQNEQVCLTDTVEKGRKLDCETGLGNATFITGAFGFAAASYVVKQIASITLEVDYEVREHSHPSPSSEELVN